jgi:hypothetical protein
MCGLIGSRYLTDASRSFGPTASAGDFSAVIFVVPAYDAKEENGSKGTHKPLEKCKKSESELHAQTTVFGASMTMNNFDSFLLEVSRDEKAEILDALKRVRPQARGLIEEIETLGPHRGLVIDGPAGIADQLRVISSQGDPALPVYYTSGEGAKHRLQLATSFDSAQVAHVAESVMRDTIVNLLARDLRHAAEDLLAHIDDPDSADLAVIAESVAELCREAAARLQGRQMARDQPTAAEIRLLPALDFA